MASININCDCGKVHEVTRDSDTPNNAISMGCNWCPFCEDTADSYYNEWYNFSEGDNTETEEVPEDPNQMILFSIADNILLKEDIELELTTPKQQDK